MNDDYIRKSALIEAIVNTPSVDIPRCASVLFRNGYYNGKAERQHEIIDIVEELPPLDEKEIIRKTFERVVGRLEEASFPRNMGDFTELVVLKDRAIEIVKEECGINE